MVDEKAIHPKDYSSLSLPKQLSPHEIEARWDGVIWLGDFNSRIEGYTVDGKSSHDSVLAAVERGHYDGLLANDQLTADLFVARNPVLGAPCPFKEGHIEEFAPTFKVAPGTERLPDTDPSQIIAKAVNVYGKKRLPAWTDRILFFSAGMADDDSASRISGMVGMKGGGRRGVSADGARARANLAFSSYALKRDAFLGMNRQSDFI